jgi:hypothetical protein
VNCWPVGVLQRSEALVEVGGGQPLGLTGALLSRDNSVRRRRSTPVWTLWPAGSPPVWPRHTPRSWSKTCRWPACCVTGAWPGTSPTPASPKSPANRRPKTLWNGGRLVVVDRWYPSSKTCSGCGAVKTKPALSERAYCCGVCGLVLDRDHNAALGLAALAAEFDTAGSGPVAARGADRKTRVRGRVAVKREPGTTPVGQTGPVPPQGRTTDRVHTKAHSSGNGTDAHR